MVTVIQAKNEMMPSIRVILVGLARRGRAERFRRGIHGLGDCLNIGGAVGGTWDDPGEHSCRGRCPI